MKKLKDREISAIANQYINDAVGYKGESTLVEERLKALDSYYSEPYGDEEEGRSSFVTSECRDIVNWALPQVLDVFISTDKIVEFRPRGPEDEKAADQATDYANFIFYEDNNGYEILRTAFQDAMITKDGYIKWNWDDSEQSGKERYEAMDLEQLKAKEKEEGYKLIEANEYAEYVQDPITGGNVKVRMFNPVFEKTGPVDRVKLQSVASEDIIFDRQASNFDNIRFIAQTHRLMRGELLEMGYKKEIVDTLPRYSTDQYDIERERRFNLNDVTAYFDYNSAQEATDLCIIYECYIKIDVDGDGIPELRKIVVGDDKGNSILENEEVDEIPFAKFGAFPQPHVWSSRSLVDESMELQRISTILTRNLLDNLYKTVNPRYRISGNDRTALMDLMRDVPGGLVRAQDTTRIEPIPKDPINPQYFDVLKDMIPEMLQSRTGVIKLNQGLDPNTINKTAYGVNKLMQAGQQRQKMMAREFAENGMRRLFKGIYGLIVKHQDRARMVRLRNEWVEIDPTSWPDMMDTKTSVGLGTGDKEKQLQDLGQILEQQKEGLQTGFAKPEQLLNTVARMLSIMGYKNPAEFFVTQQEMEQKQIEAQSNPPQPDPAVQMEQAKMELEGRKLSLEEQKFQLEAQAKMQQLNIEQATAQADITKSDAQAQKEMSEAAKNMERQDVMNFKDSTGAQIQGITGTANSIADVVSRVTKGEIPRTTGLSILTMVIGLTPKQAQITLGEAGSVINPGEVTQDVPGVEGAQPIIDEDEII